MLVRYKHLHPFPDWWHLAGRKMEVIFCDKREGYIMIQSKWAQLNIKRELDEMWSVEWIINHYHSEFRAQGKLIMNSIELAAAFGLKDGTSAGSEWLREEYGASAAAKGKFIRYQDFLNIPCPGTGQDGDPNISLKIDYKIKELMEGLILKKALCV